MQIKNFSFPHVAPQFKHYLPIHILKLYHT